MRRIGALALTFFVLLTGSAAADHREAVLVSGSGSGGVSFGGGSADGRHVYFGSADQLTSDDTDGEVDLYDRHDGKIELLSAAEPGLGGDNGSPTFGAATADGSRAFFVTRETLTSDDSDLVGGEDVYERANGQTRLISRNSGFGFGFGFFFWCGMTDDGDHVYFSTMKGLVPQDTDFAFDVYEYDSTSDQLKMLSLTSAGLNRTGGVTCGGFASDGSRAFFSTADRMTPDDTDSAVDVYERSAGGLALATPGTTTDALRKFTSDDGAHLVFESAERLAAGDMDDQTDVYDRTGGQTVLVSQGPDGGNGAFRSDFQRASRDGTRVFFTTTDRLVAADTDDSDDIFVREGGATAIVSHGPAGGNSGADVLVEQINRSGTRLYFRTGEGLTPEDADFSVDSYVWHDGALERVTRAAQHDNDVGYDAALAGATDGGERIFFTSLQPMHPDDDDTPPGSFPDGDDDIFEADGDSRRLLSTGPSAGSRPSAPAVFKGFSADGEKVWFETHERLTTDDTDDENDVYESRMNYSPVLEDARKALLRYADGSAPVAVAPGLEIVDEDTPAFTGATVRVTGAPGDRLGFTPAGGIAGSFSHDTLTLRGSASRDAWRKVLRSVTFESDGSGALGARSVSFTITDGFDTSVELVRSLEVAPGPPQTEAIQAPEAEEPPRRPAAPAAAFSASARVRLPLVRCRVTGGSLRRCDVKVLGRRSSLLGKGSVTLRRSASRRAMVHVRVFRRGIAYVRRHGGAAPVTVLVTAQSGDGRRARASRRARLELPADYLVAGYRVGEVDPPSSARRHAGAVAHQLAGARAVRCAGHADGSASPRHAQGLALRRAAALCEFLARHGVHARLSVKSHGASRPRASNATKRGRALNRRVEVTVLR